MVTQKRLTHNLSVEKPGLFSFITLVALASAKVTATKRVYSA